MGENSGKTQIQSNLVNSKSSELEVLFRIIRSSSCREVDMNIDNPHKLLLSVFFFYQTYVLVRKRNVSKRRFFYVPKHMLSLLYTVIKIVHEWVVYTEFLNKLRISGYYEKSEFEFSRFTEGQNM